MIEFKGLGFEAELRRIKDTAANRKSADVPCFLAQSRCHTGSKVLVVCLPGWSNSIALGIE
jgi:hypothetical protein